MAKNVIDDGGQSHYGVCDDTSKLIIWKVIIDTSVLKSRDRKSMRVKEIPVSSLFVLTYYM